ncbi:expressed unknown protein [Seminavis robusta]|uniref:Uncharacterized protein n=1 Tax=Seminavis robusta TaxID=568900 RepID=A0A9N8DNU5_9STRA|nr:expressed unknown protein [Seminavis robusta]|eukprot:Sro251_g099390.1 n/a (369) ;mRNA; f:72031-73137
MGSMLRLSFVLSLLSLVDAFVSNRYGHSYQNAVSLNAGPVDDDVGPKGASRRRTERRMPSRPATRARRPRPEPAAYPVATKRAPHQHDHTKADARPFIDAIKEVRVQDPNTNAPVYDSDSFATVAGPVIEHDHVETKSLDEVFPTAGGQFCGLFSSNQEFRNGIRNAMRQDIFDATPAYAGMSEKARRMLLLPDSSLQGSWRCQGRPELEEGQLRMPLLTKVLKEHLGDGAPTGDEFMDTIGDLCGSKPQTHWIDIVGITDRKISHSWHQDTGRSPNEDTKTVLFGFPIEDDYVGGGVFSHLVKLEKEQWAQEEHPPSEPVLFASSIDDNYIVRPQFAKGQEIIIYRDVDVLHSAPDVAYRSSVMRFM